MRTLLALNRLNRVVERGCDGHVIECGVSWGAMSLTLAAWMTENMPGKKLFACDTFSGLPDAEGELRRGECDYGEAFPEALSGLPLPNVHLVRGRVEETLPALLSQQRFCFAWLDMDLAAPTQFAFDFLASRIVRGGVIGFHDYRFARCPGIAPIVDAASRDEWAVIEDEWDCVFLRKRLAVTSNE